LWKNLVPANLKATLHRNPVFRALLTIPHRLLLPVADRRSFAGHLGKL
jgi:hypothetical protein